MSRAKINRHRGTCATCGQQNICHTLFGQPYSRHLRAIQHKAAIAREALLELRAQPSSPTYPGIS